MPSRRKNMKNKNIVGDILKSVLILCLILIAISSFYIFIKDIESINNLEFINADDYITPEDINSAIAETKTLLTFSTILNFCIAFGSLLGIALTAMNMVNSYALRLKFKQIDNSIEKLTTTTCKNCGKKLSIDEKFCPNCGVKNEIKKEILSHQSEQNTQEEKENH